MTVNMPCSREIAKSLPRLQTAPAPRHLRQFSLPFQTHRRAPNYPSVQTEQQLASPALKQTSGNRKVDLQGIVVVLARDVFGLIFRTSLPVTQESWRSSHIDPIQREVRTRKNLSWKKPPKLLSSSTVHPEVTHISLRSGPNLSSFESCRRTHPEARVNFQRASRTNTSTYSYILLTYQPTRKPHIIFVRKRIRPQSPPARCRSKRSWRF